MQTIKKIDAAALRAFTEAAFKAYGFVPEEAEQITDVLMAADLCGVDTHGSQRLEMYRQHINGGFVRIGAQPETVFETPVSAVVDGHAAMGQLVARYAMQIAIDKAKQSGIGMVSVRNSNHYGIAAYYSSMAASQGLVGISMTNSFPIVVPTYGRTPMMGTNPIAVAIPASPTDFSLDAATSVVAFGKPEVYLKKGLTTPLGWAINSQGVDETDPQIIVECVRQGLGGGMYPLGGSSELFGSHKGYGYAVLVEFFSACLSQGTTSNHTMKNGHAGICHYFAAFNPEIFGDAQAIRSHFSAYLQELRESAKAAGQERIYIHGEKEAECCRERKQSGIPILPKTLDEMRRLAEELGLPFEW